MAKNVSSKQGLFDDLDFVQEEFALAFLNMKVPVFGEFHQEKYL